MNTLNEYLQLLYEVKELTLKDKVSTPQLSYFLIHGRYLTKADLRKYPIKKNYRPSKYGDPIGVDYNLKESWLKDLNLNKQIQIFSVCEGHSQYRLAHIAFRNVKGSLNEDKLKRLINNIPNSKCDYWGYSKEYVDALKRVNTKFERFHNMYLWICTCPFWYHEDLDNKKWNDWFENISKVIGRF